MAPLMTRSNFIVIRGGGLSVMEQMSIPHNPLQTIFFHHPNLPLPSPLTSGVSWEDENVNMLIKELIKQNVYAQKTCPNRVERHIAKAQVVAASKILNNDLVENTFKI
jgi:effector protein SdbA